ncbi:cell wall-binding repeat-containing protein [Clostridium sp. JS66]|uniref:cell wall-binding repeat-containing protein n=1 Tax=Clostridium sp. JS66 TaxID=3064705 RepID=UPI00298DCD22|nr:cell wall-binding repeat-containing protein [Clostridium sp. JS66]WPC42541.1 cell wall-binding repeat-containing protein [Clostridium sp. JS66]
MLANFSTVLSLTLSDVKAAGVTRLGGQDRYETSVNIAKQFDKLINAIVIVNGEDYHDAISSYVFAKRMGAAILLTESNTLSKSSLDFLNKSVSKDKNVYIIGNTKRVSSAVESIIKNQGFSNVERISGQSDYDTNSAVLDKMNVTEGTPVIFASGEGYADGISISSIAVAKNAPILLVNNNNNKLQKQFVDSMKYLNVLVYGGIGSISDNLLGLLIDNSSSAMTAYSAVLQNGAIFFSTDDSKSESLNDNKYCNLNKH